MDSALEEEFKVKLGRLPLMAQIAFAFRCGSRVLPLFAKEFIAAKPDQIDALKQAVDIADRVARVKEERDVVDSAFVSLQANAEKLSDTAGAIANEVLEVGATLAFMTAITASCVAEAAYHTAGFRIEDVPGAHYSEIDLDGATFAAFIAAKSTCIDGGLSRPEDIMGAEIAKLSSLAVAYGWNHFTPVPQSVLGPLWPDGDSPWSD